MSGVLNSDRVGNSWQVAKEIVELGKHKIDILNLSFSCYTGDAQPPLALATAIDRLDPEIVVVAGAGNYGPRVDFVESYPGGQLVDMSVAPAWPAPLDDVVAVGSTFGTTSLRAAFSPNAPWIDIVAPGDPMTSTFVGSLIEGGSKDNAFASWNRTSFSTAVVSGAIAALMMRGKTAREAWRQIHDKGLTARHPLEASTSAAAGQGGPGAILPASDVPSFIVNFGAQ